MKTQGILRWSLWLLLACLMWEFSAASPDEEVPPHITFPATQESIRVKSSQFKGFTVVCKADGHPTPTFLWYRDDQPVSDTGTHVRAFSNGTLYFPDMSKRESGMYYCTAKNRHGMSLSMKVAILAETGPRPVYDGSEKTRSFDGDVGDAMSFPCANTPPTVFPYKRRWYFVDETREMKMSERIGTDSNGTLRFAYLLANDKNEYSCALAPDEAVAASSIKLYNKAILHVAGTGPVDKEPKEEYVSKNVKAVIGKDVTLDCFFSGFPIPTISWKNTSQHQIQPNDPRFRMMDYRRKLKVFNVQQSDEGQFICSAVNSVDQKSAIITVNVTSSPMRVADKGLLTLTAPDDQDVTLNCKTSAAIGESLNTPLWYRNGQPLNQLNVPDPSRYSFRAGMTELHITDLVKDVDTASFQCNVSNSEGYLFYDGYLRVIDAIEITKKPAEAIVIGVKDVVDISVRARGDHCCEISKHWKLNDVPLTEAELEKPPFVWNEGADTLLFNASSVSNTTLESRMGLYSCRVNNVYDVKIVTFTLQLSEGPTPNPRTADKSEFPLWWIAIIGGLLVLIIAVVIIIILIRNNYPGETYKLEKTELQHHLNPEEDLLNQSFQEI